MSRPLTGLIRTVRKPTTLTEVDVSSTLFFLYKNIFYKNIEAEIREILRIF